MNLSNCKTIEEYREAAHYWQKLWAVAEEEKSQIKSLCLSFMNGLGLVNCEEHLRLLLDGKQKIKLS